MRYSTCPKVQDQDFPKDVNFFERLSGLVSTHLNSSCFATEDLLPRSVPQEDTLQ